MPRRSLGVGRLFRKRNLALFAQAGTGVGGLLATIGTSTYPLPWLRCVGACLALVIHLLAAYIEYHLIKSMQRETVKAVLEAALHGFLNGRSRGNIRCNVMTYHKLRGFRMNAWVGNYPKEERSLFWKYRVGIVGKAAMA